MNKERLSNLATALEDADKNQLFRDTFSFEIWGYSRDTADHEEQINEAFQDYDPDVDCNFLPEDINVDEMTDALEEIIYTPRLIPHNCGAPACALGHFALRADLQDHFTLGLNGMLKLTRPVLTKGGQHYRDNVHGVGDEEIQKYFDITRTEAGMLFGSNGCGDAETPGEAASFVRAFINGEV